MSSGEDVDLTSLTLPAGSYLIWGRAILGVGFAEQLASLSCRLTPIASLDSDEDFARVRSDPELTFTQYSLSVMGTATLTEPTEISLTCFTHQLASSTSVFQVRVETGRMQAVEVDLSP